MVIVILTRRIVIFLLLKGERIVILTRRIVIFLLLKGERIIILTRGGSKSFLSAKNSLDNDTGMDVKCCSCLELKSRGSCSLAETLPKELFDNFCVQSETSRSFDGLFYVCITCKKSINSNLQPRRAQKEMISFLDFPDGKT